MDFPLTVHAIVRRAQHELGIRLTDIEVILPEFRYRAVDASGIVENEVCPVFRAVTTDAVVPNPGRRRALRVQPVARLAAGAAARGAVNGLRPGRTRIGRPHIGDVEVLRAA